MIEIDRTIISRCREPLYVKVWTPERSLVVLGNSNACETYCHREACEKLRIPILRRKGGGGAVLLHRWCIVVSIGMWVRRYFHNAIYFGLLNDAVISVLAEHRRVFKRLSQDGISDIVDGKKKIAGTSIFRSRNYLLYQASILYRTEAEMIAEVLKYPAVAPKYREGRTHTEFLSSLSDIDPNADMAEIKTELGTKLANTVRDIGAPETIQPPAGQPTALLARFC